MGLRYRAKAPRHGDSHHPRADGDGITLKIFPARKKAFGTFLKWGEMRFGLATTALVLFASALFIGCSGGSGGAPTTTVGALPPGSAGSPAPTPTAVPPAPIASLGATQTVADRRFGFGPTLAKAPGVDPAGNAKALIAPTFVSPARAPVAGTVTMGSYATDEGFVVRVPTAWNGKPVVAGTPATRIEFANDAIWSDFAFAHGDAFASGNKGILYNAIVEGAGGTTAPMTAYPIAFDPLGFEAAALTLWFGLLTQSPPTTMADGIIPTSQLSNTRSISIRRSHRR
jgi:hypothetical protein